jgi:hypothetical protein
MFFALGLGGPISIVKELGRILQIMKLTALMRDLWKHKGDRTPDGFFPIGNDAFDWDNQFFEPFLHFREQGGEISLRTAEERAGGYCLFTQRKE